MGKLRDALRAKYPSAKAAIIALGLDPELLNPKHLAADSKRARDGIASEHPDDAANHWDHGPTDGDPALGDEEERDEYDEEDRDTARDWRDEIGPVLEKMTEQHGRRATMDRFSRFLSDKAGWSNDQIHEMLKAWPLPKNALEGGELAGDDEERAALAEDVDWTMKQLEGMGGTATSEYEHEPKAGDRRQRARDRRMARDQVNKHFGAGRLTPKGNELVNYGDQPVLAYDEATESANADSFAEFFPDAARIRTNAI